MEIAIIDYSSGSIEVLLNVDEDYIEKEYDGDVEDWLVKEREYSPSDGYWISVDKLKIKVRDLEKDSVLVNI